METITKQYMREIDDHVIYYDESLNNVKHELLNLHYPDAIIVKCENLFVAIDN